ncbi:MAG: amidase [SAR202 cluster bacterium]|nr:amidase [SAR202 cluster bacterium]
MTGLDELVWMPAHKLREMIASRQISPVELTQVSLDRIDRFNGQLNAFLTVISEQALESARGAEQTVMSGQSLGPLHGIPTSIKDLEPMAGVRFTSGSLIYKDRIAESDSLSVKRIKDAGGLILGKTNTSEYGHIGTNENRLGDACRNPWDTERTSGASSGGAGASVAAGITAFAQGSDGAGSVRIPSAFCGIFGIKATQGRVPRYSTGIESWHWFNYSSIGPMARDVTDAVILLDVLSGPDPAAEHLTIQADPPDYVSALERGVKGLKIAYSPDIGGVAVDPEVREIVGQAAKAFEEMGAVVEEPGFRIDSPEAMLDLLMTIWRCRSYALNGGLLNQRELLTDYFRDGLEGGQKVTGDQLWHAYSRLEFYRNYIKGFFKKYDLLLTPTLATPAFKIGEHPALIDGIQVPDKLWGFTPFTYPFNWSGNPAATAPAGFSSDGLPIGLQIVGRWGDEATVIAASKAFEDARPWVDNFPEDFK